MAIISASTLAGKTIAAEVDADPRTISCNLPAGSLICYNGKWFEKLDDGDTTNVTILQRACEVARISFICGRNGTIGKNTYLHFSDGMIGSATQGIYVPWNFKVIGITFARGKHLNSGTIEVRRNGTLISGATLSTGVSAYGADMNLSAEGTPGVLAVFWNSSNNTGEIQVQVFLAQK
jgi:hypothetical protein